jgi:hypothetical protein
MRAAGVEGGGGVGLSSPWAAKPVLVELDGRLGGRERRRGRAFLQELPGGAVTFVEAAQEVDDEVFVIQRLADVVQSVGDALKIGGVDGDGLVTLAQIMEVREEFHLARADIAGEHGLDGAPEGEGGGLGVHDELLEHRRAGVVDPKLDDELGAAPFAISFVVVEVGGNVVLDAVEADGELHVLTPHGVVDAGEIELVVDVEADVEAGEVIDAGLGRQGREIG